MHSFGFGFNGYELSRPTPGRVKYQLVLVDKPFFDPANALSGLNIYPIDFTEVLQLFQTIEFSH